MSDYNRNKAAERSAIAFNELIEQCRHWGYEVIKAVIVSVPPNDPTLMVDPVLVIRKVWDKLEAEFIKQNLKRSGQKEYIYTSDDERIKARRIS